jgi:phage-related minor tail protein
MATEEARLIIRGENKTEAAFRQVRSSMGQLEGASQKLGRTLAGLGLGVSFGLVIRQTAAAVIEAEQSEARLAATLKATGNVTSFTTMQLEEMNAQLVQLSTFDDEAIRNAQAQLVKFGNISGEAFSRALKLSADYASLLGTDLVNGAQQLGRALTAPEVGLTFLERNVGKFTEATRDAIKAASDLGDTSKAQSLILSELDTRIGGTAETMNTGFTKATTDVKKAWNDMLEAIGRTPAVIGDDGAGGAMGFLTWLFKATEEIADNFDVIKRAFQGDFAARSAITDPELAAAQQREQAARDAAKASAEEAAQREKNTKAAERRKKILDESAITEANSLGLMRGMAQAREDEFNSSSALEKALNAETKAIDDQTLKLAEQLAVRSQMAQEREDQFNDAGKLEEQLAKVDSRTRASEELARDLGLTFAVTFENAIVEGEKLRDVLDAIGKDIARLIIRQTLTAPAAKAISGWLSETFGGARADGGPVMGGRAYLVGERGPELFMPGSSGQIVPDAAGATITINQTIHAGAGVNHGELMFAMRVAKDQANAEIEESLARGSRRFMPR